MSAALLDINDCNLQLWHNEIHLQSPGYALLRGNEYHFGQVARNQAREIPREINTRFWWQLGTQTLQPTLGPARHTADLVHAHLLALHRDGAEPQKILFGVPGNLSNDQLSLLLGIVQQCPFDSAGLVNRSVALASQYPCARRTYHLDVQLHQSVLCELSSSNNKVTLVQATPLPGCGLLQVQEKIVAIIAAMFVRQTRFDPLRTAQSEQQLYDSLPTALHQLAQDDETIIEINGYSARINRQALLEVGATLVDTVNSNLTNLTPDDTLLADPIAALLPGITSSLPTMVYLEQDALRSAIDAHSPDIFSTDNETQNPSSNFVKTLPLLAQRQQVFDVNQHVSRDSVAASNSSSSPTHLLTGNRATSLRAQGTALPNNCEIYRDNNDWLLRGATQQTQVNDQPYHDGQRLVSGDTISIAQEYRVKLIEVI